MHLLRKLERENEKRKEKKERNKIAGLQNNSSSFTHSLAKDYLQSHTPHPKPSPPHIPRSILPNRIRQYRIPTENICSPQKTQLAFNRFAQLLTTLTLSLSPFRLRLRTRPFHQRQPPTYQALCLLRISTWVARPDGKRHGKKGRKEKEKKT